MFSEYEAMFRKLHFLDVILLLCLSFLSLCFWGSGCGLLKACSCASLHTCVSSANLHRCKKPVFSLRRPSLLLSGDDLSAYQEPGLHLNPLPLGRRVFRTNSACSLCQSARHCGLNSLILHTWESLFTSVLSHHLSTAYNSLIFYLPTWSALHLCGPEVEPPHKALMNTQQSKRAREAGGPFTCTAVPVVLCTIVAPALWFWLLLLFFFSFFFLESYLLCLMLVSQLLHSEARHTSLIAFLCHDWHCSVG